MSAVPVIAIFDIGKTNKKFFLFDREYNVALERYISLDETTDEDGNACDNVFLLSQRVIETLTEILQMKNFDVKAVNFSAYGASLVYLNDTGDVIAPLYSYLRPYPPGLKEEFYHKYGGEEKISCETASPVLGSLNSGMQFYRLMVENPLLYQQVEYALHLPQYISFLFTRKACSDITSIGCHTQLWDYRQNTYHAWVFKEGLDKKLAPLFPSDKGFPVQVRNKKLIAGTGLHDSSAALIPYLSAFAGPFVLISTGTWCISLNPFNDSPLTLDELKQDCLSYIGYNGKAVKASRLFAGHEHDQQVKRLNLHFKKPNDFHKEIKYNAHIADSLKRGGYSNSGLTSDVQEPLFNQHDLGRFNNYEEAYHRLIFDLVQRQWLSTRLIIHPPDVKRIFVDGGFSNNPVFMHFLARSFPDMEVYAASVPQASAIGAAMAVHKDWNPLPLPADIVKLTYYEESRAN